MTRRPDLAADRQYPSSTIETELATNKHAWDQVAPKFARHCALPDWGPFGECRSIDLLGDLRGQTVLEVGCGSGDSIARIVEGRAERVYGIDISSTQIALARERNWMDIVAGCVILIEAAMEQPLDLIRHRSHFLYLRDRLDPRSRCDVPESLEVSEIGWPPDLELGAFAVP